MKRLVQNITPSPSATARSTHTELGPTGSYLVNSPTSGHPRISRFFTQKLRQEVFKQLIDVQFLND